MARTSPNISPLLRKKMQQQSWPVEIKVLAQKANVNQGTLTDNLSGKNGMRLDTALAIADLFEFESVNDLKDFLRELIKKKQVMS
jgi:hypothetical protein